MNVLVSISHPAHVHLFKNLIWELQKQNDDILVIAKEKDVTLALLDLYHIPYQIFTKKSNMKIFESITRVIRFLKILHEYHPDVVISQMDPTLAFSAKLAGVRCLCLANSDLVNSKSIRLFTALTLPFVDKVYTPEVFKMDFGKKHIKYKGYKESAYLHPNRFTPDKSVLQELNIHEGEYYTVLRLVAWKAYHDVGEHGLTNIIDLIKILEKYSRVLITMEGELPAELAKYQITLAPTKMHDILYYASLLVTDSQTMAVEAAMLGTPVIRCNSFVGVNDMSNFQELEDKYGLLYNISNESDLMKKVEELLRLPNLKLEWKEKREILLADKIDLTDFLLQEINSIVGNKNE